MLYEIASREPIATRNPLGGSRSPDFLYRKDFISLHLDNKDSVVSFYYRFRDLSFDFAVVIMV